MIRWRVTELAHEEWWAIETRTGMTYGLPSAVGESLWLAGDPRAPLASQLQAAADRAADNSGQPAIELRFAGVTARYLVPDDRTVARLASEFPAALPKLRSTPDLLVRLDAQADIDRLHRAIPRTREGVWTRDPGAETWMEADPELPVLPPIQRTPLASRFAAIHAALVLTESSATIIAGRQQTGKTTACLIAEQNGLGTVATDELVLLERGALVYGVPLPMRVRSQRGRGIQPICRSDALNRQPCRATHLVLLEPTDGSPELVPIVDAAGALSELSQHIRPLALPLGEAARLMLELLAEVSIWRMSCRGWPSLQHDLAAAMREVTEEVVT